MKKLFTLLFVFVTLYVSAQDVIIKKNGEEIQSKVVKVTPSQIEYKDYNNQGGPVNTISIQEVFMIKYPDGTRDIFSQSNNYSTDNYTSTPNYEGSKETSSFYLNKQHKYFAFAWGYGNSYGGLGMRLQGRFGGNVGFGIHGGIGYFPGQDGHVLASFGLKFFFYKWLYFNTQIGGFGREYTYEYDYYDYYEEESYETLIGPSLMVGGDFIFGKHVGFNAAFGLSISGDVYPAIDLGFVLKI